MNKMDPVIKAEWLRALRSGEYAQARDKLRSKEGAFCCLGVLCKLYATVDGSGWDRRRLSELDDPTAFCADEELPSPRIAMWSGLNWDKKVRIKGEWNTLANHNDKGRSFAEIADAIEAQL